MNPKGIKVSIKIKKIYLEVLKNISNFEKFKI